jgi:opacity protein-like surface antigen
VVYSASAQAADVAPPPAEADWYVSLFGGVSFGRAHATVNGQEDIRLDDGFLLGGAIGRDIGYGFREELEVSYVTNDNDKSRDDATDDWEGRSGDTSALFILGNMWRDFRISDSIQPYVGAGLGVGIVDSDSNSDEEDWDVDGPGLAGQLGAGLRVAVSDRLAIDLGYRIRSVIDVSSDAKNDNEDNIVFSYYSQGVQLGASLALGEDSVIMATDEPAPWYVSLFAGAIFTDVGFNYDGSAYFIDTKTGFTIGAALGTHIAPELRAELEVSYARSKLDKYWDRDEPKQDADGNIEQGFILANIWKDFHWGWITPYVGAGVGIGILHFDNADLDEDEISDDTQFGWAGQFGFGARVAVADNMSVELGYRFKSAIDVLLEGVNDSNENDGNADVTTYNHVIQAGFNWGLGESIAPVADVVPESYEMNYVSLFGGVLFPDDAYANIDDHDYLVKFKTGFTVGAAVGGNITEDLRGELEVSYQNFDVSKVTEQGERQQGSDGNIEGYFLLANLWHDFNLGGIHPYLGGGIGMALVDVDIIYDETNHDADHTDLALAAQVGGGLRFGLTDSIALDVGYRFKGALAVPTEGTKDDDNNTSTYYTHVGQVGVEWIY